MPVKTQAVPQANKYDPGLLIPKRLIPLAPEFPV